MQMRGRSYKPEKTTMAHELELATGEKVRTLNKTLGIISDCINQLRKINPLNQRKTTEGKTHISSYREKVCERLSGLLSTLANLTQEERKVLQKLGLDNRKIHQLVELVEQVSTPSADIKSIINTMKQIKRRIQEELDRVKSLVPQPSTPQKS